MRRFGPYLVASSGKQKGLYKLNDYKAFYIHQSVRYAGMRPPDKSIELRHRGN